MFLRLLTPALALLVAVAALTGVPPSPQPALACTGAYPALDESAVKADAVALVTILAAGGIDFILPPATPTPTRTASAPSPTAEPSTTPTATPSPSATPTPDAQTLARLARNRAALVGIGARARTVEVWSGAIPEFADINIDFAQRRFAEDQVRQMESNPRFVLPCPIGFLVPRYEQGHTYVLLLKGGDDTWENLNTAFDVDAGGNVVFDYLWMSDDLRERFFSAFPWNSLGTRDDGTSVGSVIPEGSVPLQTFRDAILYARGELASPPPRLSSVRPPGVGDAGLR